MGEEIREEFEAWWKSEMNVEVMDLHRCAFPLTKYQDQPYACHETNRSWLARQASRANLMVELPESHGADEYMGFTRVIREVDIESAFEAAGIKVKS